MQKTIPVCAIVVALFFVSTIGYQSINAQTGVEVDVGVNVGVGVSENNGTEKNPQNKTSNDKSSSEAQTTSKIKVTVSQGITSIKIESEGKTETYVLDTQEESEILISIESKTGLSEQEIREIWDFEVKSKKTLEITSEADENSGEGSSNNSSLTTHLEAKEKAIQVLAELKNRLSFIEERFQTLLVKLETGTYFGNSDQKEDSPENYRLVLGGTSNSKMDVSASSSFTGELFLESLVTEDNQSKFTVTGGSITVDEQTYEVIFGKARTSLGLSGEKDFLIVICELLDGNGDVTTMKLLIESEGEFDGDFGSNPEIVNVISHKSKISSKWSLEGTGQITAL